VTNPIRELDLAEAGIAAIVWATGFAVDYSWLKVDAFDEKGRPRHHRGVSSEPGSISWVDLGSRKEGPASSGASDMMPNTWPTVFRRSETIWPTMLPRRASPWMPDLTLPGLRCGRVTAASIHLPASSVIRQCPVPDELEFENSLLGQTSFPARFMHGSFRTHL
jgi:hypothetical protein